MTAQLIRITDSGAFNLVEHPDAPVSLETLQGLVDGYITRVATTEFELWVNEEGLLRADFATNVAAQRLLARAGAPGHRIVGPAVILRDGYDGESYPLAPDATEQMVAELRELGCEEQRAGN